MNVSKDKANAVFYPKSLENDPEDWDFIPMYTQVINEVMHEVLLGSIKDFERQIANVKIREKVNNVKGMNMISECFMLKMDIQPVWCT